MKEHEKNLGADAAAVDRARSAEAVPQSRVAPTPTPGPWKWYGDRLYSVVTHEPYLAACAAGDWENATHDEPIIETDSGVYGPRGADRDLIAAAPGLFIRGYGAALQKAADECRKRADAFEKQARGLCGGYPALSDQDKLAAAVYRQMAEWCIDQRKTTEAGTVPQK